MAVDYWLCISLFHLLLLQISLNHWASMPTFFLLCGLSWPFEEMRFRTLWVESWSLTSSWMGWKKVPHPGITCSVSILFCIWNISKSVHVQYHYGGFVPWQHFHLQFLTWELFHKFQWSTDLDWVSANVLPVKLPHKLSNTHPCVWLCLQEIKKKKKSPLSTL